MLSQCDIDLTQCKQPDGEQPARGENFPDDLQDKVEQLTSELREEKHSRQLMEAEMAAKVNALEKQVQTLAAAVTMSGPGKTHALSKISLDSETSHTNIFGNTSDFALSYQPEESVWGAMIFAFMNGTRVTCWDGVLLIVAAVANLAFQALITAVTYTALTDPSISDEILTSLVRWRINTGHNAEGYDITTNTSLVHRVCSGAALTNVATLQLGLYETLDSYAPQSHSWVGPVLTMVVLTIWIMSVLKEIEKTLTCMHAIWSLPLPGRGEGSYIELVSDQYSIVRMSITRRFVLVFFVGLPRFVIPIFLGITGVYLLAYEQEIDDLVFNAVALGFVLDLDEVLFESLVPRSYQTIVKNTRPLRLSTAHVPSSVARTHQHMVTTSIILAGVAAVVVIWFLLMADVLDKIDEAKRVLCEGNVDFIWANAGSPSQLYIANTASEQATKLDQTHATVLGLTELDRTPMLDYMEIDEKQIAAGTWSYAGNETDPSTKKIDGSAESLYTYGLT